MEKLFLSHSLASQQQSSTPMPPNDPTADVSVPSSPATITSREQAIDFLMGRINYERTATVPYSQRQLKLDRMRQLLNRLGNPDSGLPIVHVAGTKGKGSTSALVAAILSEAGYDTGLFSSPHLEKLEERFAVNGVAADESELVMHTERLRPIVLAMDQEAASQQDRSLSPTYFELTTALALMHFAQRKVDLAVLEVGLGGRLDSTNVCQPIVSVITSISFDHMKQLGNTLAKIAAEKAGIIKPGVPVIRGPMLPEPAGVIAEIARQHGCRLLTAETDFGYDYSIGPTSTGQPATGEISFQMGREGDTFRLERTPLGMLGRHQAANAAVALATICKLRQQGWLVSTEAIQKGLKNLSLPARVEVIARQPTVVLDVAHNVASAQALVESLDSHFPTHARSDRKLLLAVTRDKDVEGIVRQLVPHFGHIVVSEYRENPRAVPTSKLTKIVEDQLRLSDIEEGECRVEQQPYPKLAWEKLHQSLQRTDLVCITGSFFIAAELRQTLLSTYDEGATRRADIS